MRPIAIVLLATLAIPAVADEAALARKAESLLRPVMRSHRAIAKWCKSKGLTRSAYQHYMEVISIKPEDWGARKAIGYVKKKGVWSLDKPRLKKKDKVAGNLATQLRSELDKRMMAHNAKATKAYRDLAKAAADMGLERQRKAYLSRILTIQPDDTEARTAHGWERAGTTWIKNGMDDRLGKAPAGTTVAEKHEVETGLSVTLHKRQSKHFVIGSFETDVMAGKLVQACEMAHQTFHEWFKPEPELVTTYKLRYFFFPTKEKYVECIEKYSKAEKKFKEHGKKCASNFIKGQGFVANRINRRDPAFQMDRVVYLATRNMAWNIAGRKKGSLPWLTEGLAWEMTLRTLGTRLHHSVALTEGSSSTVGGKQWSDHNKWRGYLRELVLLGEAPSIATVTNTKDVNDIADARAAMAWSLTRFLLDGDRKKFAAYCAALAQRKPSNEAIKEAYGKTAEELNADYQKYVLENY